MIDWGDRNNNPRNNRAVPREKRVIDRPVKGRPDTKIPKGSGPRFKRKEDVKGKESSNGIRR